MIYGIRPPAAGVGGVQPNRQQQPATPPGPDARIDQRRAPAGVMPAKTTPAPNAAAPNAERSPAVPTQAPAGTDPELWSVLSAEERVFFAKLGAMGPLTYGRVLSQAQQASVPAARGGRLDVKV